MALFENCSVLLELKNLPFKEKKKVKSAVTENGGNISFVVNKQCSLIVTSDVSNLSSNRLRSIQKYQTPVVGVDYVYKCLERGVLLPVDEYKLDTTSALDFPTPFPAPLQKESQQSHRVSVQPRNAAAESSKGPAKSVDSVQLTQRVETQDSHEDILEKFRIYTEKDSNLPSFPDDFQVAKYSIFEKVNSNTWCVLELQSVRGENGQQYRVVRYRKDNISSKKAVVRDMLVFPSTSEQALVVYKVLRETAQTTGLQLRSHLPPPASHLGSAPLQQLLLEEKLNTGSLSEEVGVFVELLWTEAQGCLDNVLSVPIGKISLNDVTRVEGLLLQAQKKLKEENHTEVTSLLDEVQTLLPQREPLVPPSAKLISQKLDLCQLIRDVLNVSEMTLRSSLPSSVGKYRALRCGIEAVPPGSSEFQVVTAPLQSSTVQIQQVLRVSRAVELQAFKSDIGNVMPLLHASSPSNFVGLLSRGLLLPRVGVEQHGIQRTDIGNLGSGIYFTDSISTSLKYAKPSETDGSRLLLVCDVALGRCKEVRKRDLTLTQAPEGHHSVHGVPRTRHTPSDFEDDEFVVYSPDQVKLKYVVRFSLKGDELKEFSPATVTTVEPCLPSSHQELSSEVDGVENVKRPVEDTKSGLIGSSGQPLPLQAVHVKCKLMDLLSQVIIFQKYTNQSSVPIEAKYVFPLDDSAAVCGFEAFINGKHVVGQVKEKEKARKEYKQAIEKGHGAYLMDQDAPDVFTISVGNLPPGATVLIKVTFVSELIVKDGGILFSLPGSVAPWQEGAALNQTTQVTVEKVCVTDEAASNREFTLDVSVEMPYEIASLKCITHKVKIKRTDCKVVVSVLPGEVMGSDGFQLSITLSEVHLPRMWVEQHPDKDSQACMLVFYPDFNIDSSSASDEVILLLDTSESMMGQSLLMAQRIALQVLKTLDHNIRLNVILFGTDHKEAFLTSQPLVEIRQEAERSIKCLSPVGGSTELWRPLRALSLLPPSCGVRNLLLLSDGHIQNPEFTLQLLRDNVQHSRLFTCGLSPTANRHMLRALAHAGGGAYEFFDTKTKHNWAEKVASQVKRMASPGCSSVSVKWQQFNPTAPPPVQTPKQLHALFNDCHTLVYGFVPHCTQATLLGNLNGQELKTMVSTSELQKTKGTFLHKLTARALIRDYEDGSLDADQAEHEGKKAELKHFIIELSKEFSILSQFTSFVAIEERDSEQTEEGFTDIPRLIAEEDVDFLPYVSWMSPTVSMDSWDEDEDIYETFACDFMESEEIFGAQDPVTPSSGSELVQTEVFLEKQMICDADYMSSWSFDKSPALMPSLRPPSALSLPSPPFPPRFPRVGSTANSLIFGSASQPPPPPPPPPPFHWPDSSFMNSSSSPLISGSEEKFKSDWMGPVKASAFTTGTVVQPQVALSPVLGSAQNIEFEGRARRHGPMFESHRLRTGAVEEMPKVAPSPVFGSARKIKLCRRERRRAVEEMPQMAPGPVIESAEEIESELRETYSSEQMHQFSDWTARASELQYGLTEFSSLGGMWENEPVEGCSLPEAASLEQYVATSAATPSAADAPTPPRRIKRGSAVRPHLLVGTRRDEPIMRSPGICRDLLTHRKAPEINWTKIFQLQHSDGYWELTSELGDLINVDVDLFANVFLKNKGIHSLGVRAHADILRLLATLLVLQLMRVKKLEEGKLLHSLFRLEDSYQPRPERWEDVKRAVDWVCWADRQYPCVYSRLEFGLSWESSTRQLLGYEGLPPFSPLSGLNLQRAAAHLLVH